MRRGALVLLLLAAACGDDGTDAGGSPDADYLCASLVACFAVDVGDRCARELQATTTAADLERCADCWAASTCEAIGAPGVPGVCDTACDAAFYQVARP